MGPNRVFRLLTDASLVQLNFLLCFVPYVFFLFENYEIHFILKRQIFRVYYKIILFLFNTAFYFKIVLSDLFCLLLKTN